MEGKPFLDKGPWKYGYYQEAHGRKKHYVQSDASGENFDDMRLYLNGNMTDKMYEKYGNALAEFLNSAVKPLDSCVKCGGKKGGVPGNENIINGEVICDYCS